jgi:hypothetical protein
MRRLSQIVVAAVVFLAVYFFSYWLLFVQIISTNALIGPNILALIAGLAAAILVWQGLAAAEQGIVATAATWAAIAGAVGFCGGFFGPMIFTPHANQGPLLGLFITGPLGFVGGGVCGALYAILGRT